MQLIMLPDAISDRETRARALCRVCIFSLVTKQGLEQQLKAVMAHEDAYHFEAQLDELSKGRQAHAELLAEMAEECAAALSEVRTTPCVTYHKIA